MINQAKKVLVVEDDLFTQKIIGDILKSAGYQVITARYASATMKLVREQKPDLITLDINLAAETPEDLVDGFTVATWLKRLNPEVEIPIIIVSGTDPNQIVKGAASIKAYTYLPKPVEKAKLLAAVAGALK